MTSWRWWFGWTAVPLSIAGAILAWSWWNLVENLRLRKELALLAAAGEPICLAQVPREPAPVGPNAYPLYEEACALLIPHDFSGAVGIWLHPLSPEKMGAVRLWITRNRQVIDLLLRAAEVSECRAPIPAGGPIVQYNKMGACIELLGGAAFLASCSGEHEAADRLLAAAMGLIRVATDSPHYGAWHLSSAVEVISAAIDAGHPAGARLKARIDALPRGLYCSSLPRDLQAVRASTIQGTLGSPSPAAQRVRRWVIPFVAVLGPLESRQLRSYLSDHANLVEALRSPTWDLWRKAKDLRESGSWLELGWDSAQSVWYAIESDMTIDLVKATIAGAPLRADDGTWPDTWPELEAITDLTTGKPFVRRREGKVLVVESAAHRWDTPVIQRRFRPRAATGR